MPFASEEELKLEIRSALGEPTVKVELDDTHMTSVIKKAKRWLLAKKGIILRKIVPVTAGQPEYTMTDDVENVLDVNMDIAPDLIAFFSIGFFDILPFGFPFAFPTTPSTLQYSGYVQLLQFNELRKRIFSIEPAFDYSQQDNVLTVTPLPVRSGNMLITYKSRDIDVTDLTARDEQLLYEYASAQAKLILGRIRRKYSEYPTAGGGASMDGEALVTEANEEIERLNKEIFDSQGPMGLLVG